LLDGMQTGGIPATHRRTSTRYPITAHCVWRALGCPAGFMIAVLRSSIVTKTAYPHVNKLRGFVRTCAVRKASKTGKPDNKRITALLRFSFLQRPIACQSFIRLDLHPAGLEPCNPMIRSHILRVADRRGGNRAGRRRSVASSRFRLRFSACPA